MAYDDALFQLGMDLDPGSSTAQTEEKTVSRTAETDADDRKDYFCERDGIRFAGTHLIVDLMNAKHIDDVAHVEETFRRCVYEAGATLLNMDMHHFTPNGGVTGVAILAESHISIHSWPEYGYAALDIFMCGDADPHAAIPVLREAFEPEEVVVTEHLRGRHVWEVAEAA